ncbi:MAG TPA: two-component system sensor histidine kinase NtrB [Candidatus Hypogeohydataceae bacterium YC40]
MNQSKDLFQEELIERLYWFIRLRWFAVAGVLGVVWVAYSWKLVYSTAPFIIISLILLALNFLFSIHANRAKEHPRWTAINARVQITSDLLCLLLLLHYAGGAENPFLFYFIFHTILAGILLERRESYFFAFTTIFLFGTLVFMEYTSLLPHYPLLAYKNPFVSLLGPEWWKQPVYLTGILFVFATTVLFSTYFTVSIATRLRERSRRLKTLQEELLRMEKDKWKAVIECMNEGVVFVDNEGKIAFYNASAAALKEAAFNECYPASMNEHKTPLEQMEILKNDNPDNSHRILNVGGRLYENACSTIKDSEGKPFGVVLVSRDITERKEMEKKLMHQEKMTVIGKLAAGVAHELNNPLGVISMFTQMALKKISNDNPLQEYLDIIKRNTDTCKKVIQSLLSYARMVPVHPRNINLNECLMDVLFMCRPLLEKHGIKLETELSKEPIDFKGDPDLLRQVFMNIVVNAIQAQEKGGKLRVVSDNLQDDGILEAVRIVFEDNGPGIAPEHMAKLFEPFFTTKPEGVGTGLGLSTCKNIVEGHGGFIQVESEVGKGSRFAVVLPIRGELGWKGASSVKAKNLDMELEIKDEQG